LKEKDPKIKYPVLDKNEKLRIEEARVKLSEWFPN
jgi:hypothetical protein